jgi:hypothetical protein
MNFGKGKESHTWWGVAVAAVNLRRVRGVFPQQ